MRKWGRIVFAFFYIVVLAIAALWFLESLLDQHEPVTPEYFKRLAVEMSIRDPHMWYWYRDQDEHMIAPQTGAEQTERAGIRDPEQALPKRLERAATPEERAGQWRRREGGIAGWFKDVKLKMESVAALLPRRARDWRRVSALRYRAYHALEMHHWTAARQRFLEVISISRDPGTCRDACSYLAWLEDDPELAVRYMDLACSDETAGRYARMAYDLAWTTGSMELAEYYWARVVAASPRRPGKVEPEQETPPHRRSPRPDAGSARPTEHVGGG